MSDFSALKQATATFDEIALRYQGSPELRSKTWQREQVADRRFVLDAIGELATEGRRQLTEYGDEGLLRRFEDSLARFRHALGLHQANWPVVTIDQDNVDYLRSRLAVRAASRDLTRLIEEIVEQTQGGGPSRGKLN